MGHTVMINQETEGVIKFTLSYTPGSLPPGTGLAALNHCRSQLWQLGVIGQDAQRYAGLGYGNVSLRLAEAGAATFLITGTQTGHWPVLTDQDYARVLAFDISRNWLQADGGSKPSSEAMTHAAIYQQLPEVQAVVHGHSPVIWQQAQRLGLACTAADIAFGTPQMALAMQAWLQRQPLPYNTIAMLGHQDGFITWGSSLEQAFTQVQQLLQAAAQP